MGKVAKNAKPKVKNLNSQPEAVVSAQLQKKIDRKIKQKRYRKRAERGVVLLRHLPKGFFEEQIKAYFAQFGDVTRVRLARSRKTGGSKSFAFIEFRVPEVAQIAAETMDNYLMFQKLVKAHYIPPGEQKFDYLRSKIKPVVNSHGKTVFSSKKMLAKSKLAKKHNNWNERAYSERVAKAMKKLEKMKTKYSDLGIDFDSIVIKPKLAVPSIEENLQNAENLNTTNTSQTSDDGNEKPGKLLIVKKRKNLTATDDKTQQKKKKEPLRLLLEETLNDSDTEADEDYLPTEDYNPNETLEIPPNSFANILSKKLASKLKDVASDSESDESFKLSDVEEDDDEEMESEEEDENLSFEMNSSISETEEEDKSDNEETKHTDIKNKTKKSKFEKESRLEKIIRRKPGAGGIIKRNVLPKSDKTTAKKSVQLGKMKALAAGEIVKEKNLQKVKKTDLKMKKKVK